MRRGSLFHEHPSESISESVALLLDAKGGSGEVGRGAVKLLPRMSRNCEAKWITYNGDLWQIVWLRREFHYVDVGWIPTCVLRG